MSDLRALPAFVAGGRLVHVVVESPAGTNLKLRFDPARAAFVLKHRLPAGVNYPYPWGFVPGTGAADGDPLDAMVLLDAPTWPGVVIPSVPLALIRVVQRDGTSPPTRNDRIIARPGDDDSRPRPLTPALRRELERFFVTAGCVAHTEVKVRGWEDARAARTAIRRAAERFARRDAVA